MTFRSVHLLPSRAASIACLAWFTTTCGAQTTSESELAARLDRLATELAEVKAQLAQLKQQQQPPRSAAAAAPATASTLPDPTSAPAAPTAVVSASGPSSGRVEAPSPAVVEPAYSASLIGPGTVWSSYGEINYNRPTGRTQDTTADLRRFVLGYQHRFDERTKVVAELEIEHAVSSSDDPGEVEIEQAFVERQLTARYAARGGLFLIPAGLLNENHEPTAYYGVERDFVETAIIPTTWREGGLQFIGNYDNGLTAQAGVATGFDLTRWAAGSAEGRESPLGSIHQELALAKARDLSVFAALNWRGVPGLLVGASVFTGGATHRQAVASARVTLWDVHARWTPGRWDFSTLYARGTISNTATLNAALVGNPTLIPASFDGAYVQGAYKLWSHADYALSPFVRVEQFNTARSYTFLGEGLTPRSAPNQRVLTVGANFQVAQGVVLKADYQRFRESTGQNRFDLGLGWSF